MVTIALLLSLFGQPASPAVYAFVAPVDFVDDASKERDASLKDLRDALVKRRLTVVNDAASALLTLEVLARDEDRDAHTRNRSVVLRVKMTFGDYETTIVSECSRRVNCWRVAADDVAKKVEQWIVDNAARLKERAMREHRPLSLSIERDGLFLQNGLLVGVVDAAGFLRYRCDFRNGFCFDHTPLYHESNCLSTVRCA